MCILASIKDPKLLPYGAFSTPGSFVIHDRRYRPLVRFAAHKDQDEPCEGWGNLDLPGGIDCLARGGWPAFIRVRPETAEIVAADERIAHDEDSDVYLYKGEPDQAKLQRLIDQFPELAAEIQRRDAFERRKGKQRLVTDARMERARDDRKARIAAIQAKPLLEITESDLRVLPIGERLKLETKIMMARYEAGHIVKPLPPRTPMPTNKPAPTALPTPQNAATLLAKSFDPVRYVIPGYIAEGCSILAGKPKIGKSWFVLDAALAVAGGNSGRMFGLQAEQGNVLYLALEDNERRLKSRIKKVLGPFETGPERFTYATEWKRADEGGLDAIEAWIKSVPKATLIIVDVLARFRPMATGRNTAAYDADYAAISGLQGLASKYSVAMVVVHHLRKNAADNDPFDKVSGTLGLSGAADTILIIDRDGQGTTLYGRGRDIEEIETAVQFDKAQCRWVALGKAGDVRISSERKTIVEALKASQTAMSPTDIATETGMRPANVRKLLSKLVKEGDVMKAEYGKYLLDPKTPVTPITVGIVGAPITPGTLPMPPSWPQH
jgi:AAA domain-containing protein/IclR-like helix-turn-helix domain-containing protein